MEGAHGIALARGSARAIPRHALVLALLLGWPRPAQAQGEPETTAPLIEKLSEPVKAVAETLAEGRDPPPRLTRSVLDLPRSRFGSGSAWQPDATPLYASLPHVGRWGFLLHGNLFAGYDWFGSERGGRRFVTRNAFSVAAFHAGRRDELLARVGLSLEPLTIGERGYPLILQTGQSVGSRAIHDRQHALELFRELGLSYAREVSLRWALSVYAAVVGEPALGPVAFVQRSSASADPFPSLGFQWQDGSHSSFGVLTVGAFTRALKLEASWFNGREPDRRHYDIDLRLPDSFAGRISWNPRPMFSLQTSYGFLKSARSLEAELSTHRVSASLSYARRGEGEAGWAATLSFAERVAGAGRASGSLLAESYWNLDGHHALSARAELVQKTGVELALSRPTRETHLIGSLVAGYVYYFGPFSSLLPGLGVRFSLNPIAESLERDYGTRAPFGVMVFAQLRTAALPPAE